MPEPPRTLDLPNLPDADVVALAQQGREAAFRELVRRYERPVFSLIFRMVRDRETSEDLAQDTFIKVLNHIDRYRPEFKLSSWLFKIANNVAIDHLRKRQLDTISIDGSPHAATAAEVEATSFDVARAAGIRARGDGGARNSAAPSNAPSPRCGPSTGPASCCGTSRGGRTRRSPPRSTCRLGTVKTYIHRARHELREALGGRT